MDRDGYEALSMRALAEQLDTGAASLYWHVGSKDGLLDLVLDELIGEVAVPAADPARWRDQVREMARAQRASSHRHPYLVRLSIGRIPLGPKALALNEGVVAIMRAGGLPPRLAVQGFLLLIEVVNGFTLDETGVSQDETPPGPEAREQAGDMVTGYLKQLPADRFPNLTEVAGEFAAGIDERFDLLIDIFVDGLARRAGAEPA
jgi:AcrR family transcriptional regulator